MAIPLLYALHSGNLYGTERMALATCCGLAPEFEPVILAPPGPALSEARRLGFHSLEFDSAASFASSIRPWFAQNRTLAVLATGVTHSLAAAAWNAVYRRRMVHLHVVHGGTDERLSYGRKRLLNRVANAFVAVSDFVRQRLIAHRVSTSRIRVIENFLATSRTAGAKRRASFLDDGNVRRALVISRVDPVKRIDLLLDALDRRPVLSALEIHVLGSGWDLETLRERAARRNPNVRFAGFVSDVESELATSDLLIHLCPSEPFGLAILEAMAAGVPVLVPDSGGAGSLVADGVSGFRFRANDSDSLADCLTRLQSAPADLLNQVVKGGFQALETRFSASERVADYRRLLMEGLA